MSFLPRIKVRGKLQQESIQIKALLLKEAMLLLLCDNE